MGCKALRNLWFCNSQSIDEMIQRVQDALPKRVSQRWSQHISIMFEMNVETSYSTSSEDSNDGATRGQDGEVAGEASPKVYIKMCFGARSISLCDSASGDVS